MSNKIAIDNYIGASVAALTALRKGLKAGMVSELELETAVKTVANYLEKVKAMRAFDEGQRLPQLPFKEEKQKESKVG